MYSIIFKKPAINYLKKLDKNIAREINKKIMKLKITPGLGIPLGGNLSGLRKLRIGKFRVIYEIKNYELIIYVLRIGHRKNIYE
ncbi:MAG: type II toxin-antitoxin system RelE/ParE family toxin [archaeon]